MRYIKLGPGNSWFKSCRENRRIELGHAAVPHELAGSGDWEAVACQFMEEGGRSRRKATDFAREVREFYTLGADCLWITFAEGRMWWTFTEPEVQWLGGDSTRHGVRFRRCIGTWHDSDVTGVPLEETKLSTWLTKVGSYWQTICSVEADGYAVRRINAQVEPVVQEARALQEEMNAVAARMIGQLHWRDFEVMVDLIFARNGWRRMSAVGGTQKDFDIAIEHPLTGERAYVQIKSRADAAVLRDYAARLDRSAKQDRFIFVCHSPRGVLDIPENGGIDIWTGARLAAMALKTGLFDWLVERSE